VQEDKPWGQRAGDGASLQSDSVEAPCGVASGGPDWANPSRQRTGPQRGPRAHDERRVGTDRVGCLPPQRSARSASTTGSAPGKPTTFRETTIPGVPVVKCPTCGAKGEARGTDEFFQVRGRTPDDYGWPIRKCRACGAGLILRPRIVPLGTKVNSGPTERVVRHE
jgi:hypothetical protein